MTKRLAMATIPIRRIRPPPSPNRCLYQRLNLLLGWKRSQAQAISMISFRTRRLPVRLIPCSRTLSPLLYGVGVSPTAPAT